MKIGSIPNNTAYFSNSNTTAKPLSITPPDGGSTAAITTPWGSTAEITTPWTPDPPTEDPNTPTPETPTPIITTPEIVTPPLDEELRRNRITYSPHALGLIGKREKVICRVVPNITASVWIDRLAYVAFVTSSKCAFLNTTSEDIHIRTDLNQEIILPKSIDTRIDFKQHFDVICYKKNLNKLTIKICYDFDGEIPINTPSPAPPTPSSPIPEVSTPVPPTPEVSAALNKNLLANNVNFNLLEEDE